MKTGGRFCVSALGFCLIVGGITSRAHADNDLDAYIKTDAEGVPYKVAQPKTQDELDQETTEKERAARQAANKNWLLRSYDHQLRAHEPPAEKQNNPSPQLSTDKNLSTPAGISDVSDDSDPYLPAKPGEAAPDAS